MIRFLATLIECRLLACACCIRADVPMHPHRRMLRPIWQPHRCLSSARLTEDAPEIETGLVWRVFEERRRTNGEHALVATAEGGSATFDLPTGKYLVHAAYGRAGATKLVEVDENGGMGDLTLRAGGLQLAAEAEGTAIPARLLRFSVYDDSAEDGWRAQAHRAQCAR